MAKKKPNKKGKKVRVHFRPNRSQPARDKSWTRQYQEHGFEDQDPITRRSFTPKGDLTRKRTVIEGAEPADKDLRVGRVLAMRGLIAEVDDGHHVWPCTIRRILRTRLIHERHPVTVGDRVKFAVADEDGVQREGMIYAVEPRTSCLTRRYQDRVHVIAANIDQVVIVSSVAQPPLKPHLIDRYLVAAHAGNIQPVVCINKIDLEPPDDVADIAALYRSIGYPVILSSVTSGDGIEALRDRLRDCESVVVGQSGVGKSSLLNAVQPGLKLATGEVSDATSKGIHTTTTTHLLKLDLGGYVVDTPGVRSYDLAVVPRNEYELHFLEFGPFVPQCKFPDCTHIHEDGCAVQEAVDEGAISVRRYESYCRMYEED